MNCQSHRNPIDIVFEDEDILVIDKPSTSIRWTNVLAKTPLGADRMGDQMKAREVTKEYVARVKGEFPRYSRGR
nr:BFH_HP1_G0048740.mRNA.1.CDS.1 [Saccharomyces cerevisiae]